MNDCMSVVPLKSELIITAGGENVAPVPIEDAVREALSPCLSNCMVIGDKRRFLSILVTLKVTVVVHSTGRHLHHCHCLFEIIILLMMFVIVVIISVILYIIYIDPVSVEDIS